MSPPRARRLLVFFLAAVGAVAILEGSAQLPCAPTCLAGEEVRVSRPLRVRVIDDHARPLCGAAVRWIGSERSAVAATDADGRATLDVDPFDDERFEVFAAGHVLHATDAPSPCLPHDDPLLVVLEPGIPLPGRVGAAEDGRPIAGARVRVAYVADLNDWIRAEGRDASVSRDAGRSAPTSSDGSFRFDHILSLPLELRIELGGRLVSVDARAHAIAGQVTVLEPVVLRERESSVPPPALLLDTPRVPFLLTVTRAGRPYDGPLRVSTRRDPLLARSDPAGPALVPSVRWASCLAGRASVHVPSAFATYTVEVRSAEAEPASASGTAGPQLPDPTVVRGSFDLRVP